MKGGGEDLGEKYLLTDYKRQNKKYLEFKITCRDWMPETLFEEPSLTVEYSTLLHVSHRHGLQPSKPTYKPNCSSAVTSRLD